MIIWQVKSNMTDGNRTLFVAADTEYTNGKCRRSYSVLPWNLAKDRPYLYYFYMEFIK